MPKYPLYTLSKEKLQTFVNKTKGIPSLLLILGYKQVNGGSYALAKKRLAELDVDISHWNHSKWSSKEEKEVWKAFKRKRNFTTQLVLFRGHKCECCNNTEWLGNQIKLEVHHIDGNPSNNDCDNLQLLCPNCHSFTPNYCGKNQKKENKPKRNLCKCGNTKYFSANMCYKCSKEKQKYFIISKEDLQELVNKNSLVQCGKILGVSDNAVKKRCKVLGVKIPEKRRTLMYKQSNT